MTPPSESLMDTNGSLSNSHLTANIDRFGQSRSGRRRAAHTKKAAARCRAAASWCLRTGLERVRNVVEGRAQLGANARHGANSGNGDQSSDQTIFDGGRALLVLQHLKNLGHLWS